MDKDIAQLLSWYVNGTLTGAERDRVELALRDDPRARALLEWEKSLRRSVQNDPQFDVAEDRGLSKVMQRIKAEARTAPSPPASPRRTRANSTSGENALTARFREWFRWSPALALACGVVAVQFGIIAHMTTLRGEESEYAGVRSVKARHQDAFVRVSFKPETTEIDLRALLREVNAEIVSGPSQLGDYYLVVSAAGAPSALATLQGSANVESAEIVRELPSRPL